MEIEKQNRWQTKRLGSPAKSQESLREQKREVPLLVSQVCREGGREGCSRALDEGTAREARAQSPDMKNPETF